MGVFFNELRMWLRPPKRNHHFLVVTAVYNAEEYIRRSIDSVWAQDYPRDSIEQVILDDASTDLTAERVELWLRDNAGKNARLVKNTERVGGCANLTRAFREAPPDSIVLQV